MGIKKIVIFVLMMVTYIICKSQIIDNKIIEEIFNYGALAASSHNAQMWRIVKESENLYRVELDSLWRVNIVDPHDREAYISIGTFVQNCIYAAPHYDISVELLIKNAKAYLKFSKNFENKKLQECTLQHIERRHTCRRNFSDKPIPIDTIQMLCSLFKNVKYVEKFTDEGIKLSDLIINSSNIQLSSKESMNELSNYVSSNNKDKIKGRGLTLEDLGLNGIEHLFFRIIYAKKNFAHNKSFHLSSIKTTKRQLKNCAGFFILFAKQNTPNEMIKTGMELERFWIMLNSMGISVHPMSQPLEECYDEVTETFQNLGLPEMILRVGYCKHKHSYKKLRKKIEIQAH